MTTNRDAPLAPCRYFAMMSRTGETKTRVDISSFRAPFRGVDTSPSTGIHFGDWYLKCHAVVCAGDQSLASPRSR
jgi:hypothetical protein